MKRSGASLTDIEKFEKTPLGELQLPGWFYNFLKLRNDTRTNLKNDDDNIWSSSDGEDEKDKMPAISDDDTGRMSDAESNTSE